MKHKTKINKKINNKINKFWELFTAQLYCTDFMCF